MFLNMLYNNNNNNSKKANFGLIWKGTILNNYPPFIYFMTVEGHIPIVGKIDFTTHTEIYVCTCYTANDTVARFANC